MLDRQEEGKSTTPNGAAKGVARTASSRRRSTSQLSRRLRFGEHLLPNGSPPDTALHHANNADVLVQHD